MFWHPTECTKGKSLYSSNPELLARFVKDSALTKREMLPGVSVEPCFFLFASIKLSRTRFIKRGL